MFPGGIRLTGEYTCIWNLKFKDQFHIYVHFDYCSFVSRNPGLVFISQFFKSRGELVNTI